LEGSRTNLIEQSEYIDSWSKAGSLTISNNNDTSPEGIQNASLILPNAGSGTFGVINSILKSASSITYTLSGFAKAKDYDFLILRIDSGAANGVKGAFDLSDGTISTAFSTNGTGFTLVDADIKPYENNWYRYEVSFTTDSLTLLRTIFYVSNVTGNGFSVPSYTANGTDGILFWGLQAEAGSYPTSYIPNHSGGSVTRGADSCYKIGISSLIGQMEGTLFIDINNRLLSPYPNEYVFYLTGTGGNQLWLRKESGANNFTARLVVGGSNIWTISVVPPNGLTKIAIAYKSGDSVVYLNGTQVNTSSATFSGNVLEDFYFSSVASTYPELKLKQAILFNERLTNAELATLTTL